MDRYIYIYIHAYIHTYTHTHTHTHARTHLARVRNTANSHVTVTDRFHLRRIHACHMRRRIHATVTDSFHLEDPELEG